MCTYHGIFVAKCVSWTRLAALIKLKGSVLVVTEATGQLSAIMINGVLCGLKLERGAVRGLPYEHIVKEKCRDEGPDELNDSLEPLTLGLALATLVVTFAAVVRPVFVFAILSVRRLQHGPLS